MSGIRQFKVHVIVGGEHCTCDGIEWKEKLWLVPHWLEDKASGVSTPARIIRFESLPHQPFRDGYVVTDPVPKELFDLAPLKQPVAGFEYVELPALSQTEGKKPH
jgi:hypothetical protein